MHDALSRPAGMFHGDAADFHAYIAYVICAALIVVYAWDRFNTPPTNRSSTRQLLYWESCVGYVLSALGLFGALSLLLEQPVWRELLGLKDNQSMPAPLLATLALTTLLPRVPMLNRLDRWLLDLFLDLGAIPAEVKRRAAALRPHDFIVTAADVKALTEAGGDDGLGVSGDAFAHHLRYRGAAGLELSRLRFTRVVKLYSEIHKLAAEPRYSRFFDQNADDFTALKTDVDGFIRGAVTELEIEARLHTLIDEASRHEALHGLVDASYQEVVQKRERKFAEDCRQRFILMARFLARAVLRSESSEKDIVVRLQQIGFPEAAPIDAPKFPLNSLTALGLGIFAYLVVTTIWFSYRTGSPAPDGLAMAGKLTIARLASIGMTVWLLQQFAVFRRAPGERPRYFAYLVNGAIGGALAAGIWILFRLSVDFEFSIEEVRVGMLSGFVCAAVAFCCDDIPEGDEPPVWLRAAEALGCGGAMAAGTALVYALGWAPPMTRLSDGWALTLWIALPSTMAAIIGACVPQIYREARRAAATRRALATPPSAATPADPGGPHELPGAERHFAAAT
jgi:hypothetical protein